VNAQHPARPALPTEPEARATYQATVTRWENGDATEAELNAAVTAYHRAAEAEGAR
jgi:hypothetical protein